jgi:hypothetical protein
LNRIFLAPSCSAPAYACKSKICVPPQTGFACLGFACAGIARRLEKCWGKTRVRVFLLFAILFLILGCGEVTAGWTLKADTLS